MAGTVAQTVIKGVGGKNVPQEVRQARKNIIDFHSQMGQLVIHKHRWNDEDVREGRASKCPYHDNVYEQDLTEDPYCFGTGFLGGWANGQIVYVTIGDAPTDMITFNEQGQLVRQSHPDMTAPWTPDMGDGDMIIITEFAKNHFTILDTHDRFILREVNNRTMRGPNMRNPGFGLKPFKVGQEANIDSLPFGHYYYQVPISFDYDHVPLPPEPPGYDPGNYPAGTKFAAYAQAVRVIGQEPPLPHEFSTDVRVTGGGNDISITQGVRVTGATTPSHVYLE